MLLAVTHRPDLLQVLRAACSAAALHGIRAPHLAPVRDIHDVSDVVPAGKTPCGLVIDLDAVVRDPDFKRCLTFWRHLFPGIPFVLIMTMRDIAAQATLLLQLGAILDYRRGDQAITLEHALVQHTWIELLLAHPESQVVLDLQAHFETLLPLETPNRGLLLQMLTHTVTHDGTVNGVAKELGRPDRTESANRALIHRQLKESAQPTAREIFTAFRVTAHSRLVELAQAEPKFWSSARRARILGSPNPKALAKSLRRRTGYSYEALVKVPYPDVAAVTANFVRPRGSGTIVLTFDTALEPLVQQACAKSSIPCIHCGTLRWTGHQKTGTDDS